MTFFLQSVCRKLFSSPLPLSRRRFRGCAPVDALEERVLLTVDLQPNGGSFDLIPTNVPNQYTVKFTFSVKNTGTTEANLSGNLQDSSDNVRVRAVFSTDDVYGNGDDTEIGVATFIAISDLIKVTLAAGASKDVNMTGMVTAQPGFNYFLYKVDSTDKIAETIETNNVRNPAGSANPFNYLRLFFGSGGFVAGTTRTLTPNSSFVAINETNFANAKYTVKLAEGKPGDQLGLANGTFNGETLKRAGKNLKLGSEVVGTVSGGKKGAALVVQFGQGTDNLLINEVISSVTFKSKRSQPGERAVQFGVDVVSGQQIGGVGTITFEVNERQK